MRSRIKYQGLDLDLGPELALYPTPDPIDASASLNPDSDLDMDPDPDPDPDQSIFRPSCIRTEYGELESLAS
jgi:hypothetical protein